MELKDIQEKENKLFQRMEISAKIESNSAPSKVEILNLISEKYKKSEEVIEILKIDGEFGSHRFIVSAEIYDSKEAKDSTILKSKKQRDAEKKAIEDAKKAEEEAKKKAEEEAKAAAEKVEEIKQEEAPASE